MRVTSNLFKKNKKFFYSKYNINMYLKKKFK